MPTLGYEWVPIGLFIPVIDIYLACFECDEIPTLIGTWLIPQITDDTSGGEPKIFWWLVGILAGYLVRVIS